MGNMYWGCFLTSHKQCHQATKAPVKNLLRSRPVLRSIPSLKSFSGLCIFLTMIIPFLRSLSFLLSKPLLLSTPLLRSFSDLPFGRWFVYKNSLLLTSIRRPPLSISSDVIFVILKVLSFYLKLAH